MKFSKALLATALAPSALYAADKPNILFFLVDDMGTQDTSVPFHYQNGQPVTTALNSLYRTPNMERLARDGRKFTNAYSYSVCSPTRVSLMNGQSAVRHGVTNWTHPKISQDVGQVASGGVKSPQWTWTGLDLSLPTLPGLLKNAGYTTLFAGKAHFGPDDTLAGNPLNCGFDVNIAGYGGGGPGSYLGIHNYSAEWRGGGSDWNVPGLDKYHGTDTFLSEAITLEMNQAITNAVSEGKPFFSYMSHYAVHVPWELDERFSANYPTLSGDRLKFATLVEGMDKSLGDILANLESLGVAEETLVVFFSDNGSDGPAYSAPLKGKKGQRHEGGIRVPLMVSWAKVNPDNPMQQQFSIPSGTVDDRMVTCLDMFPTVLSIAGASVPEDCTIDGYDVSSYFTGGANQVRPEKFVAHFPHTHNDTLFSTMVLDHKKINYRYASKSWEMYDLTNDVSETTNLLGTDFEEAETLAAQLIAELDNYGASYPLDVNTQAPVKPNTAIFEPVVGTVVSLDAISSANIVAVSGGDLYKPNTSAVTGSIGSNVNDNNSWATGSTANATGKDIGSTWRTAVLVKLSALMEVNSEDTFTTASDISSVTAMTLRLKQNEVGSANTAEYAPRAVLYGVDAGPRETSGWWPAADLVTQAVTENSTYVDGVYDSDNSQWVFNIPVDSAMTSSDVGDILGIAIVGSKDAIANESITFAESGSTLEITDATLLHHWKFEENLTDEAGAINSSFNAGPGSYVAGQDGSALSLEGTKYVVSDPISIGAGNPSCTVSGWFNIADTTTNRAILSYNNGGTEYMKLLFLSGGELRLWFQNVLDGTTIDTSGLRLAAGKWYYFTVVKQGLYIKLYLDGNPVKSGALSFTPAWTASQPLRIGANGSAGQLFHGAIDDVKVYNYALTAEDVRDAYNVFTPSLGIEVVQTGTELAWSVEDEVGVKEYHIVDVATGKVIEVVVAGSGSYRYELRENVEAKLVIVDYNGFFQAFLPSDDNIVKVVYELNEDWNLIAMPGENADISALKDVIVGGFWGWDGTAYEMVEVPSVGNAVWVYALANVEVVVSADKVETELNLNPGWNMVGPTENIAIPEAAHTVYGWNETYQNIATESGILLQGIGYWIFSI